MCGRYALSTAPKELLTLFNLQTLPQLRPRFNIAPTQVIDVVRAMGSGAEATEDNTDTLHNRWSPMRWGLIPAWSSSPEKAGVLINARAETVATKPSFREGYRKRHCLIPASGFYEWQKSGGPKQPFYIGLEKWKPFAMAGIWEEWTAPDGALTESCCILTTDANDLVAEIHARMPVILKPRDYHRWLWGTSQGDTGGDLLRAFPADQMQAVPVSTWVNKTQHDDPRCIKPAPLQQKLF
jgi:putative SOS response-associated peptidase YedK